MIGQTLGHYRILEKLGEGGMGEVYKARDTRLERFVALKILHAEGGQATPSALRARLLHEARAAAALSHPHICTVYEVAEVEGVAFAVFELIEGRPLSELIPAAGFPAERVVRHGMQIADGLAHAHDRGVVHRDLKSANVMIATDGRARILDFGVARRLDPTLVADTHSTMAAVPTVSGTLAYMAPEVLCGSPADIRADIWALGVVLFEMAVGSRPFRGETVFDLSSAILRDPLPQPPARVPMALATVVARCLARNLSERYQHAGEVKAALEAIEAAEATPRTASSGSLPSLAVLPFVNLSADKDNEYFSDGLAEDIIDALAQVPGLRVMARTSSFSFRGKEADVREIGARLNVEHILEGSVRRSGSRLRVTAQLIKTGDGYHLWSERFDREMTDVFAVQDEISRAIVDKLRVQLERTGPLVRRQTDNLAAYDLCLKARHQLLKMTHEGREAGRRYCEQAIALDPRYAPAYVVMAESCLWSAFWGEADPRETFGRAKVAAGEALRLDGSLANAHSILGTVLGCGDFDWGGAEREFERARAVNRPAGTIPHDYAWCYAMWFLLPLRRMDAALEQVRCAVAADPLDPFYNALLGNLLFCNRQLEASANQLLHAIELDPSFFFSHWLLSSTYAALGRLDEAVATAEHANELSRGQPMTITVVARYYGTIGRVAEARRLLDELLARRRSSYVPAVCIAYIYRGLGEFEESAKWLALAVEERDPIVVTSLPTTPTMDPLRSRESYNALLRSMNLEPQRP